MLFESSVTFQLPSEFSNEDICPDVRIEVKWWGEYIIINAYKRVSVPKAIFKHLARSILRGGEVYVGSEFEEAQSTMVGKARQQESDAAAHTTIAVRKQENNRKWSLSIKPQGFPPVTYFL